MAGLLSVGKVLNSFKQAYLIQNALNRYNLLETEEQQGKFFENVELLFQGNKKYNEVLCDHGFSRCCNKEGILPAIGNVAHVLTGFESCYDIP